MAKVSKTKSLIVTGPAKAHIDELKVPFNFNGGAIGQVLAAGICGSDLSLYNDGPLGRRLWPLILGHENIVRLTQMDEDFSERWDVKVGDRVAVEEFIPCGHCNICLSGNYRRCRRTDYNSESFLRYGRTPLKIEPGLWGGFSQYIFVHPDAKVHKVPDSIPTSHAPLFVPIANGIRWVTDVGRASPGESVVVLGPGAHGLGCVLAASEIGASTIIAIGLSSDAQRLETAKILGATHTLFADKDDIKSKVAEITGSMADLVVEVTAGASDASKLATELAGPGGRVVLAGGGGPDRKGIDPEAIIRNEVQVNGVRGHDLRSIVPAIKLMASGKYDFDIIGTKIFPLEMAQKALELFTSKESSRPLAFVVSPTEEI